MNNTSVYSDLKSSNRLLFERGDSFQGNMPLTVYFIASAANALTEQAGQLTREEFLQFAEDVLPYAGEFWFCYENGNRDEALIGEYRTIASNYVNGIEEKEYSSCKYNLFDSCQINSVVVLKNNGDVIIQGPPDSPEIVVVGNIKKFRFADIWYSPLYLRIRYSMQHRMHGMPMEAFLAEDMKAAMEAFPVDDSDFDPLLFLDEIHGFETGLALDQKDLYAKAKEAEDTLDGKIRDLYELEETLRMKTTLLEFLMNAEYQKAKNIEAQFAGRVNNFGLLAAVFPFRNPDRDWNKAIFGFGQEYQGNMPMRIELSLLYGCNIRCFMCDLSKQDEERQREMLSQRLDIETYTQLAQDVFPYIDNMIIGVAGEPTLHPDFTEFLRIAKDYGVRLQLMTNGTTLYSPKIAEAIVKYVDEMVISMDGCTKETFEKIRTGASWDRVTAGLRKIKELREKDPESHLKNSVNFALMKENIEEFPRMFAFAKDMGIQKVMGEHLIVTSPAIQHQSLFNYPELSDRCLLEAFDEARRHGIEIIIPDLFNKKEQSSEILESTLTGIRHEDVRRDVPFCRLLTYSVVITPLGHVYPCCYPDAHRMLGMGNLHQKRFRQIWYGRPFQTLREGKHSRIPYPCNNCSLSGRSDGDVPLMKLSGNSEYLDGFDDLTPYPLSFVPRRIRFIDLLIRQNNGVRTHLDNIKKIEDQAIEHETYLHTLKTKWIQ